MDGPPPQEEDFSSIPIQDRLSHKNWKARVSAYEALIKVFQNTASDTDPAFKPYIGNYDLLKKIATDANAVAQEKGVECLASLVKYAGETSARTREAVMPALVDKCFGSSRTGTRSNALELTLQYVEVENNATSVVNDLLPGLSAKQPKTVAGCVFALKEIIRIFGVQVAPPPPILKSLPKVFSHNDKTVRAEGTVLSHVLYQYIGPGIEPWLAELKPVQIKDLKEAFETMEKEGKGKGSIKPERYTRAQARDMENAAQEGGNDTGPSDEPAGEADLDPRAFAEPVDIVSKLSSTLQNDLKSSKWKERKEALDDLSALLSSTPRIKDAPELAELAKSLATRIASDANINCVMVASKCMEDLAKGMMSSFSRFRESVVSSMLERLKERKTNVTDSIGAALDAVFSTVTLADIIPDLEPALKNKNPQVKEGTLKFLARCLSGATAPIQTAQIKPLAENLATLLEDGHEGARNEAAVCLGTLMKMVGERPLNATMEGLADVRKSKVKEAFDKSTVKCKLGTSAPPRVAPPPAKKIPATKTKQQSQPPPPTESAQVQPIDSSESSVQPKKLAAKPPVRLMPGKKPAATPATASKPAPPANNTKQSKGTAVPGPSSLDAFKYRHTPEEAESLAVDLIPAQMLADLGDSNWKARLAALEEMTAWVEEQLQSVDAEVIIRALAKKGWAEKNFQVSSKLYGILSILAEKCPSFGRSCVALCVTHLTEKLGDAKLKKPAGDTLTVFAEKTSLQFVLNQAYDPLSKQKAPKVLADALVWVNTAITEFGIAGLSLRALIDFLKLTLQNSNAGVRSSATKALVTLKLYAGSSIKDLIQDLNTQLLNTIIAEFDKVEGTSTPEPTRTSTDVSSMATSASSSGKAGIMDPMDELFPRVEIDGLLKGTTILADAKSDAWKTKKEALETLQAILNQGSNKKLKPTMGEIGQVLKARVTDSNKVVQSLALDIVSRIATGMGKAFEKHSRLFVLPISSVLTDQKASARATALQTLTAIATACEGLESMVSGVSSALETSNPLQKGTLLHWLVDWFKEHDPSPNLDINPWVALVVSTLDDRNTDVRKGAQALLPTLITCAGFDYVLQQTNSLKPASRSTAVPLIQAARPATTSARNVSQGEKVPSKYIVVPPDSPPDSPTSPAIKPATKAVGVRRKLPQGTVRPESRPDTPTEAASNKLPVKATGALKRPGTMVAPPSVAPSQLNNSLPFHGSNQEAKRARLGKDAQKWINESGPTRKDLAELLQNQMEAHCSKDLIAQLFSHDHNAVNDHINGLTMVCDFYNNAAQSDSVEEEATCLAVLDLPLKYVSIKAHEPQSNLASKCLDTLETLLLFVRHAGYQLTDNEALCFVPTMIYKLGDAREQVRSRVSQILQTLPMVYPYSRIFQLLLEYGSKSKVAKTRQGSLDELASILKKSGLGACEPAKAFPLVAAMIADKDSQVRRSALVALSEGYVLVGEKIWSLVGVLPAKEKTQLEERLRRIPISGQRDVKSDSSALPSGVARLTANGSSPPISSPRASVPRPASPSVTGMSRTTQPSSPTRTSSVLAAETRPGSPARSVRMAMLPSSPKGHGRPQTMLPSRLARPRTIASQSMKNNAGSEEPIVQSSERFDNHTIKPSTDNMVDDDDPHSDAPAGITITISSILSSDPSRSVDALKKVQKILVIGPETGHSSPEYLELAEHTEGLIETITLQMAHVFERPEDLILDDNFRLAKHLIQTLNNFCDHSILAESLTVDILTSLLEELTLRLLETDDSSVKKVKDLSRFINMIILRLFATGRKMSIFRALFTLLLRIVKPFPSNGTLPDSKESKVAELVLKCVWKLARSIPEDLSKRHLDPVELFPAIEHFLQSVPPNEWRARATNKVPCGDMPLRTIKVIIQHVVAHYGDEVYDLLSESFDDPSATIVYPYVYRILNSGAKGGAESENRHSGMSSEQVTRVPSPASSRPLSPQEAASNPTSIHRYSPVHHTSTSSSSNNGHGLLPTPAEEPDPDAQLLTIIGHISSETTGALHKEGITELHHFLKAHPHKRQRVEKMLESTGAAFRKYINRALASRAAEDQDRDAAVAHTLSRLESNKETEPTTLPESSATQDHANIIGRQDRLAKMREMYQSNAGKGELHNWRDLSSPTRTSFE